MGGEKRELGREIQSVRTTGRNLEEIIITPFIYRQGRAYVRAFGSGVRVCVLVEERELMAEGQGNLLGWNFLFYCICISN